MENSIFVCLGVAAVCLQSEIIFALYSAQLKTIALKQGKLLYTCKVELHRLTYMT